MSYVKTIFLLLSLLIFSCVEAAPKNPLFEMHVVAFEGAKNELSQAKDTDQKLWAYQSLAQALDSLDRSDEALVSIDKALQFSPNHYDLLNTKAKILVSLGRYQDALDELLPRLEKHRQSEDARGPLGLVFLQVQREGFIAAVYAHVLLGQYDAAVDQLSYFGSLMEPETYKYRACWYLALRAMGAKPNTELERSIKQLPLKANHYDEIIALLDGRLSADEAIATLNKRLLDPESKQDAMAEMLFFIGVNEKVSQGQTKRLEQLNALEPYGSAEWKIARTLFK
jgi:tetratricopeptide (TPR) repeat protein